MLKNLGQYIKAAAGTRSIFGVTAIVILAVTLIAIVTLNSPIPPIYILTIVLVGFILIFVIYWLHYRHVSRWPPGLGEETLKTAFLHGYAIFGTSRKLLPPDKSQKLLSTPNQQKVLPPGNEEAENTERNP